MVPSTSNGTSGIVPGTSNGTSGIVLDTSDGNSGIVPGNSNGSSGIVPNVSNGTPAPPEFSEECSLMKKLFIANMLNMLEMCQVAAELSPLETSLN